MSENRDKNALLMFDGKGRRNSRQNRNTDGENNGVRHLEYGVCHGRIRSVPLLYHFRCRSRQLQQAALDNGEIDRTAKVTGQRPDRDRKGDPDKLLHDREERCLRGGQFGGRIQPIVAALHDLFADDQIGHRNKRTKGHTTDRAGHNDRHIKAHIKQ